MTMSCGNIEQDVKVHVRESFSAEKIASKEKISTFHIHQDREELSIFFMLVNHRGFNDSVILKRVFGVCVYVTFRQKESERKKQGERKSTSENDLHLRRFVFSLRKNVTYRLTTTPLLIFIVFT